MNDRQRIEALLFPVWLLNIIHCGVNDKSTDDYKRCVEILGTATEEALKGCDDRKRAALLRRVARVHNAGTDDYRRNNVHVDKIGLIALYTLQAILEADYLVLEEGTPLAAAITAIIDSLSDAFAEPRLDASARKHASKLLGQLQDEGYFWGITTRKGAA